jgi:hypothetical protein
VSHTPDAGELGDFQFIGVDLQMEWPEAREYCRTHYNDLASIHTADENALVTRECAKTRDYAGSTENSHYCYIGLSDTITEGEFQWSDGSDVNFLNWKENEPNDSGGGEDWVQIFDRGTAGGWNDNGPDNGAAGTEWGGYAVGFVCQSHLSGAPRLASPTLATPRLVSLRHASPRLHDLV